jgi:hypothetical protein
MSITRRHLLVGGAGLAAGASVSIPFLVPKYHGDRRPKRSRVAILWSSTPTSLKRSSRLPYDCSQSMSPVKPCSSSLILWTTFLAMPLKPTRQWSLLRPERFRRLGANSVLVAEGPGHQRDTQLVLSPSGYEGCLRSAKIRLVDLNHDEVIRTRLQAGYSAMKQLWLPRTVLDADFVGSMPKIKAHHWSGVTLSMKNMFGIVPGMRYGWPK